jgi:hypothetical protein
VHTLKVATNLVGTLSDCSVLANQDSTALTNINWRRTHEPCNGPP